MAVWWCMLVTYWAAVGALGEVIPGGQFNLPTQEELHADSRGRQLYYLPQGAQSPQLQRLELGVDNPDAQYYQPNQQRQDVQTFAANDEAQKTTKEAAAPAKLETLEPDAELIPGAQQQPQGPPTQVPVAPQQPNIPGLLPGQRFYIVHPQHQIYQNPIYPGLPNGFRPNIQVPGYQRFYIVAQPTVGDGNFAAPAGYQNAILIDPTGQGFASPQLLQPNFNRLISPETQHVQQNANTREPAKNPAEPIKYQEPLKNYPEQSRNYAEQIRAYQQQNSDFGAQQQQFGPGFTAGAPPAALPFFGFGRQADFPFQQQQQQGLNQVNPNQVQFSQLLSLQPGQSPQSFQQFPQSLQQYPQLQLQQYQPGQYQPGQFLPAGQLAGATSVPAQPQAAQGRNDNNDYSGESGERKEDVTIETENPTSQEDISENSKEKSAEPAQKDPKNDEDSKEIIEEDKTPAVTNTPVHVQKFPKLSNKQ